MPNKILTPAMWHDHDIDFVRWLHPTVWHVALESWQWIHQVAAPCNVNGCGMTCHWIRPNVRHIGILHLVSISTYHYSPHVILYHSAKFYPNQTTLGRKKWRNVDFQDGGSPPSCILWGPIMGSLKSLCATSYRSLMNTVALNCLVFEKIAFFLHFGETDR